MEVCLTVLMRNFLRIFLRCSIKYIFANYVIAYLRQEKSIKSGEFREKITSPGGESIRASKRT